MMAARASIILATSAAMFASSCSDADTCATPHYSGVNLSGGEFGAEGRGRYGFDYHYPDAAEAAPFLQAGMNAVRVPIRWERVQPAPSASLDPAEMARLDSSIAGLAPFSLIIIDLHDYGAYAGKRLDLDDEGLGRFARIWRLLAQRYKNNPRIGFGLMNEPNGMSAFVWRKFVDAAVQAIRAAGATNLILVPGTNWTGAHGWYAGEAQSNAAAFADFADPGYHSVFEVHQYLDADSSGTHTTCVSPKDASERLAGFTSWLRAHHVRGFLGEFGVADSTECLRALDGMLTTIDAAPDVWAGWTYWSAGSWWGKYPFSVQPDGDKPKPQMQVLRKHIRNCR